MKHLLFFTCFLTFLPMLAWSQVQLGLTIGAGLPMSDFADTDGDNDDAGFARTGIMATAVLDYNLSDNLGITGSLLYGSNAINENTLDDFFAVGTDLETKPYSQFGLFAGLLAQFPSEGLTFKIRAAPGLIFARSYGLESTGFAAVVEIDPVTTTSIALKVGAGIDVPISDQLNFVASIDYLSYTAKYEGDIDTNVGIIFSNQEWEQATKLIHIGVGVALVL